MVSTPSVLAIIGADVYIGKGPTQEKDEMLERFTMKKKCNKETIYRVWAELKEATKCGEAPNRPAIIEKRYHSRS